jgi:hypothetical protein
MGDATLRVEPGERVVLSPASLRFKDRFRQERPTSAEAVRALIGVTDEMANAVRARNLHLQDPVDTSAIVAPEELESDDAVVRNRAMRTTQRAFHGFVRTAEPDAWGPMEAAIGAYLAQADLLLQVAMLQDIEVLDGGVLTVPAETHLVQANNVTVHGTGRIDCTGYTKFEVASFVGL